VSEASGGEIPARDHARRSMERRCPDCARWTAVALPEGLVAGPVTTAGSAAAGGEPWPEQDVCRHCGARFALQFPHQVLPDGALNGCAACGYHTLCIQKDVNGKLGVLFIVVVFAGLLVERVPLPILMAVLVPLALLDWLLLRRLVKRLLICYRCKALFRGFSPGPRCRPYDLATWEAHDPVES